MTSEAAERKNAPLVDGTCTCQSIMKLGVIMLERRDGKGTALCNDRILQASHIFLTNFTFNFRHCFKRYNEPHTEQPSGTGKIPK